MNSKKWSSSNDAAGSLPSRPADELSQGVGNVSLKSEQDDGEWEVCVRKSKNKAAGSSSSKSSGPQKPTPKAWGHPDVVQKLGMRSNPVSGRANPSNNTWSQQPADFRKPAGRGGQRLYQYNRVPQPAIGAPLEHGWNWQGRGGLAQSKTLEDGQVSDNLPSNNFAVDEVDAEKDDDTDDNDVEDDSDVMDDSDDDLMSDEFDSDSSQKSHGTRKNDRWFKKFFEIMDSLSVDEINDSARQWHCPACRGGPGAIDWYRGLQPLMTHAKTIGAKRVKLHRELAVLLDEELRRRGTSVVPAGEAFGIWKGLKEEERDYLIVWPPMVVIMNTKLEKDENEKWIGMGNQELLDYFSSYQAVKARHAYGPQGHRGMSILIFENSPKGYFEAERLHKHFADQGTDRSAWRHQGRLFTDGGKRQLYGYMAMKEDLENFNRHSQGKSKLKYDMRSYKEMVVDQMKLMAEENQLLVFYKNKYDRSKMQCKSLEKSHEIVCERLRKTMEENRIVILRTKMQHEQNKEEMDYQEEFFKERMRVYEEISAKEEDFEREQEEKREKVKQLNANPSSAEEQRRGLEEMAEFIQLQEKEVEKLVAEKEKLMKEHEDKLLAMRKRHLDEQMELEKEFKTRITELMEKYSQGEPGESTSATDV